MDQRKPVTASVILESRSLRAELRLTVATEHSEFFCESHLSRLAENAEALLPSALASEAPPLLRQVIEKCESLLLQQSADDLSLFSPKNMFAAEAFLKANGMSRTKLDEHPSIADALSDWVSQQPAEFSIAEAAKALDIDPTRLTRDLQTRIGTALCKLGCTRIEVHSDATSGRTFMYHKSAEE